MTDERRTGIRLDRIYTRGGDRGLTSLSDGSRVRKNELRVETYGTVNEANAAIGIARLHCAGAHHGAEADLMLGRIQNDLFDLGADLSTPEPRDGTAKKPGASLRIVPSQVDRLEREIDAMNARLQPLNSFILPGGTPLAAYGHLALTIVRRAERLAVALDEREAINEEAIRYLNRLSDHLFVLSRFVNDEGALDVLWVPGATRGEAEA